MKKMMLCMFALAMALSLSAFAQDNMGNMNSSSDKTASKSEAKPKLMTLKGWVSDEKCGAKDAGPGEQAACAKKCVDGGSAIVFVNDKDHSVWSVKNPETLKDHVGHHVKLSAHVYADNSIHVMKVSMLGSKKKAESTEKSGL